MSVENDGNLLPMTGIILAGGKSSRMGRNKAFLEWEGRPLIERTLDIFTSVFAEVLISANNPELYSQYDLKVVPDNFLEMGPMGGLEACLKVAKYEYSFFAACDMPFLEEEVIRFMAAQLGDEKILVPKIQEKIHPLHAFYHRDCQKELEAHLQDGHLKMTEFVKGNNTKYLTEGELGEFPNICQVLTNMNTPEDFSRLRR